MSTQYMAFQLIMELAKRPECNYKVEYTNRDISFWTYLDYNAQLITIKEGDIEAFNKAIKIIQATDNDS